MVVKLRMKFIQDNSVNYWPHTAESPDINPIDKLWHEQKDFLRMVVKLSIKEIVARIQVFWDTVTPDKSRHYIGDLKKGVPICGLTQG